MHKRYLHGRTYVIKVYVGLITLKDMTKRTIGGSLFVHDGFKYDYCLEAALNSLLAVCDTVSVVDAESTDGTLEWLREQEAQQPKLKVHQADWKPVIHTGGAWLADVANIALSKLEADYHVGLQADEVLHEDDFSLIRECAERNEVVLCHRINFWEDPQHVIPHKHVCGHRIIRCAPTHLRFGGDAESLQPRDGCTPEEIRLFHYGFIRNNFIEKAKYVQTAWLGDYDARLKVAETKTTRWTKEFTFADPILPYNGTQPKFAHKWLSERGYTL